MLISNFIKYYSLWWRSNIVYTLTPERRNSPRNLVRRICDGLLLSFLMLPGTELMLKPLIENNLKYIVFMTAISSIAIGNKLFCLIIKRTVKNPSEFCQQYPFLTTALFYMISHFVMLAFVIYFIVFFIIMNIVIPYF